MVLWSRRSNRVYTYGPRPELRFMYWFYISLPSHLDKKCKERFYTKLCVNQVKKIFQIKRCWDSGKLCEHTQCAEPPFFGTSYCFIHSPNHFVIFPSTHPFASPPLLTRSTGTQLVVVAVGCFNNWSCQWVEEAFVSIYINRICG